MLCATKPNEQRLQLSILVSTFLILTSAHPAQISAPRRADARSVGRETKQIPILQRRLQWFSNKNTCVTVRGRSCCALHNHVFSLLRALLHICTMQVTTGALSHRHWDLSDFRQVCIPIRVAVAPWHVCDSAKLCHIGEDVRRVAAQ